MAKKFKRPIEADEIKIILNVETGMLEFPDYCAWHDFFSGKIEHFRVKQTRGVPHVEPYREATYCG